MDQSRNEFLETEPVGRLLLRLSAPAIAAQLINMLYNLVDRVYIGHIPEVGSLALTGVGVCMPVIMIVSAFAALVSMGAAPRASICMGQRDTEGAERILGSSVVLQALLSLLLTAVLLIWNRPLLLAFGASENTIGYASGYMSVYALGTIFVELTLGLNAFITAQGQAKIGMLTVAIGAVANIVLDPLFIFVFDMGVQGAALATILSQAVSCIWAVAFLCSKQATLRLRRSYIRLDWQRISPCLALGLAPFIMQASESLLYVCFNSSLLRWGGDLAVGAMTILTSVMQIAMLPLQGFAQGAQPISSYNFGAKNPARVRQTFFLLLACDMGYSILIWACVMLFPGRFASLFTSDPELIAYASRALRIYLALLGFMGIQIACQMTFISIGYARSSVIVAVVRKFAVLIPLIYLLPRLFRDPVTGIYAAEPIADFCAYTFTAILFSVQFRRALKALESDSDSIRS